MPELQKHMVDQRYAGSSNRGHDSLTVYDVGADGRLTPRQWAPSGGKWPWFFALTDDNRMIVGDNLSDAITIFDIDTRGELRASDQVTVRRPVYRTFRAPVADGNTC